MKMVFLFVSMILCLSCQGRLEETKEQCDKRYGKGKIIEGDFIDYQKGDWIISITFKENVAFILNYSLKTKDKNLSFGEINSILEKNKNKSIWKKLNANESSNFNQTGNCIEWKREDGKAFAVYYDKEGQLVITSDNLSLKMYHSTDGL